MILGDEQYRYLICSPPSPVLLAPSWDLDDPGFGEILDCSSSPHSQGIDAVGKTLLPASHIRGEAGRGLAVILPLLGSWCPGAEWMEQWGKIPCCLLTLGTWEREPDMGLPCFCWSSPTLSTTLGPWWENQVVSLPHYPGSFFNPMCFKSPRWTACMAFKVHKARKASSSSLPFDVSFSLPPMLPSWVVQVARESWRVQKPGFQRFSSSLFHSHAGF